MSDTKRIVKLLDPGCGFSENDTARLKQTLTASGPTEDLFSEIVTSDLAGFVVNHEMESQISMASLNALVKVPEVEQKYPALMLQWIRRVVVEESPAAVQSKHVLKRLIRSL